MSATASAWNVLRDPETAAMISTPPDWQPLTPPPGCVLAIAYPTPDLLPGAFRPNILVTVERVKPEVQGLRAYSLAAVEAYRSTFADAHVIAVDVYPLSSTASGRRMLGFHRTESHDVVLTQYWAVADGVATVVSASCAVDQYAVLADSFNACM